MLQLFMGIYGFWKETFSDEKNSKKKLEHSYKKNQKNHNLLVFQF